MQNRDFSFKEYLIAALRGWKTAMSLALVLASLFALLGYLSFTRNRESILSAYESKLARHNEEVGTKQSLVSYHRSLANAAQKYNENSLLMQINPYDKQVAMLNISVSVEPKPEMIESAGSATEYYTVRDYLLQSIVSRYLVLAKSANLGDVFKDILPKEYDETYLRELVTVTRSTDTSSNAVLPTATSNTDRGLISVVVTGAPDLDAKQMADAVYSFLISRKEQVEKDVQAHELTLLDENNYHVVDDELVQYQALQRNLINESNQKAIVLEKEADSLRGNRPQMASLASTVVRNALVGFLLGVAFGILIIAVNVRLRDPLQYVQQLQELMGISFLGGVVGAKRFLFKRIAHGLTGEQDLQANDEAVRIIAANVADVSRGLSQVMLTGTISASALSELAKKIVEGNMLPAGVAILSGSNANKCAETVQSMTQVDAVILVERLQDSRLREVWRLKERVELAQKPILGYVVF